MTRSARDEQATVRDVVLRLLHRDLQAMQREIEGYPDDDTLWRVLPGIANSGGTLALHLCGNLRHFVGRVLGGTAYVRNREAEFSTRGLTRAVVSGMLGDTIMDVTRALRGLDPAVLDGDYPEPVGNAFTLPAGTFLMHLAAHSAYHLGQVDYHRRIVTGDATTMTTIPMPALFGELPNVMESNVSRDVSAHE